MEATGGIYPSRESEKGKEKREKGITQGMEPHPYEISIKIVHNVGEGFIPPAKGSL